MALPDMNKTQSVEVAAGACFLCLADLAEKAAALPAGEMRKAWTTAATAMREALDTAAAAHRNVGRPVDVEPRAVETGDGQKGQAP